MNGVWLAVMVLGAVLAGAFIGAAATMAGFAIARSITWVTEPELDDDTVDERFDELRAMLEDGDE